MSLNDKLIELTTTYINQHHHHQQPLNHIEIHLNDKQLQLEAIKLIQISLDKLTNTKYLYKNSQNLCKNLLINRLLNKSKLYYYQTIVQTIRYSILTKLGYYINLIQKNNYSENCIKDIIKQLIENLLNNTNELTTLAPTTTTTTTTIAVNHGDDAAANTGESSLKLDEENVSLLPCIVKRKSIDDSLIIDENNNTINNTINNNKRIKLTDLSNSMMTTGTGGGGLATPTPTEQGHNLMTLVN